MAYTIHCKYAPDAEIVRALLMYGTPVDEPLITYRGGLRDGVALHIAVERKNHELVSLQKEF